MRSRRIPQLAAALSIAWLAAQALDLAVLAAAVAVAAIASACELAERRQAGFRRWLRVIALGLATTLGVLLLQPPDGGSSLALMLVVVAVAGVVLPLLYAATFEVDGPPS